MIFPPRHVVNTLSVAPARLALVSTGDEFYKPSRTYLNLLDKAALIRFPAQTRLDATLKSMLCTCVGLLHLFVSTPASFYCALSGVFLKSLS